MPVELRESKGLLWYTSTGLTGVRHGFSTRQGGVSPAPWDSLNLRPGMGDGPEALRENYRRFCAAVGLDPDRSVLARQVHETTVRVCTEADAGKGLLRERDYTADALISNVPGLALFVFSADCGTILLHDPVTGAVGAVHAGWRGCAAGIAAKTVRELNRVFGARPEDLQAALGPCIGPCCFETDADVPEAMREALGERAEPYLERRGPKWYVDLQGLNRQWLLEEGVPIEQIDACERCTVCYPRLFWSHRKLGDVRGAQCGVIAAADQ